MRRAPQEIEPDPEPLAADTDRLRSIFAQSPVSTQVVRADGVTIAANQAFYDLWGVPPGALADYNLLQDPQLARKGILAYIERAFAGETVHVPPVLYDPAEIGKPGRARWVRAVVYPVLDGVERVREIVIQHEDVTGEMDAVAAMRASEERFRALFEASPLGIAIVAPDRAIAAVNPALCAMLGCDPEALVGSTLGDVMHPDDRARGAALQQQLFDGAIPEVEVQQRFVRKDGSALWAQLHVRAIRGNEGELRFAFGIAEDITERLASERHRSLLAAIVESSDDAIVSKDLDGVVTSWNRGAERMFGYTAQEAVGRPLAALIFPPGLEDEEARFLQRIRAGERVDHFETRRRRKDGSLLDVSVSLSPLRDASGRVTGAGKVARDISDRKRVERLVREAEEMRIRFVNMAAHELKTPMTPLKLQVSLLRSAPGALTPTQRRSVEMLDRNLDRLDRLVDDVLDAARLQAGRLHVARAPLDLNAVVQDAVDTFAHAGQEAGVTFDARLGPPLPIEGDAGRLAQVLFNLLGNALKYTAAGGRVEVATRAEGSEAVVEVHDTGVGLSDEDLESLFLPFSQVRYAREDRRAGTGLGLYISKGIVEQHGGRILAQSPGRGRGATFTVRLPLAAER